MISNRAVRPWLLVGVAAMLAACTTNPINSNVETAPKTPAKVKVGLALGGGAAKGFAHIGVIKVLEAAGIEPEIITGTSAGSVVGSLYASGMTGMQLQAKAMTLGESELTDWTLSSKGVLKGEKLQSWINAQVGNRPLEKLPKSLGVVATELDSGRKVVFRTGNTGQAVRASASIPNVFLPVKIGNKSYVDGGLVSPVPVSAAREMGAQFVIAVDITARPKAGKATGFFSMLDQSLNIMNGPVLAQELKQADVVIQPKVLSIGSADFEARHQAILEGEKAAQQMLPQIRKLLQQKSLALAK
ncbi:patatin-like phospholipase family protein [Chromobacterium sp. IIBBL 290-4]|uniref:patatin-like phospholipase family protein n=1 Tax=Chromobacterium sp. IIBBL 290-4 TaxID=2953890 RepID=UPI0020B642BC|nr:patatin-like phospholipase family protein [Chromobacterium sp. IIBBL 290-4]UTH75595.1 patatin-like phospholipase family protein [Chromobacterium sp. IIBBL 290-4]